ncbi:hypothetical protein ACFO4E_12530 [Nocardiopsis mangrovi]|uniref:Uncharacterized protein n=1 Tax=Nocardiopsis mangrovi TaxID=1179818 RepID=A0ABV9DXP4_9ACTN
MTEQHFPSDAPLISMPALTPAALRTAIAQIAPARLPSFGEHLDQAVEQAAAQSTTAPLRAFLQYWGEVVAIQRRPDRAARLRELEAAADAASDRETLDPVIAEIQQILEWAQREVVAA